MRSDPPHLQQIVVNLVTNAVKYGRAPITVAAGYEGPSINGEDFAVLRVSDSGDGVPAAFVPQMFERFTQSDLRTRRSGAGTGLGLSIVKGLAEAQDGEVWYEPNEPRGARFCVRLPAAADA